MSEENVEIVRKAVEIVNARKIPEDLIAPDIRMQNVRTAVTDNVYVGTDGIRQWQDDFLGVLDEEAQLEAEEVVAAEGEVVVVKIRVTGHGLASGVPFDVRWFAVHWLREGRITHIDSFATRREALEAAGLRE